MPKIKSHKTVEQIAKKHRLDVSFIQKQLDMGEPIEHEHTQDHNLARDIALQHLDEIPDYYTRLKKMEADAKKHHKKFKDVKEETASGDENLGDWFRKSSGRDPKTGKKVPGWKQIGGPFAGAPCARQPGQTSTPKCGSSKMAANLSDEEEEAAFRRKNRKDPNQPEKTGAAKPTNVRTEEMDLQEKKKEGKKDACYHKVKSRYSVWPSAYASGALVKCRKAGADNWGTKSEEVEEQRYCPLCDKRETRSECSYGEKAWDKVSIKDHEYSMARSELKTIIDAVKRLKMKVDSGEGDLEAWVQSKITKAADYIDTAADYVASGEMGEEVSMKIDINKQKAERRKNIIGKTHLTTSGDESSQEQETSQNIVRKLGGTGVKWKKPELKENVPLDQIEEATRLQSQSGNVVAITILWRGKYYTMRMFFPQLKLPSRQEVTDEIQKVYPGAKLVFHSVSEFTPGQPMIQIGHQGGSFASPGPSKKYVKPYGEEFEYETIDEDWQKINRQDKTDGLSPEAVKAYRRENPGSKLQTAVTEKNPEGKRAKRRKSFCRRMRGMKSKLTSAKTSRDPDSRINKALRRWNCN